MVEIGEITSLFAPKLGFYKRKEGGKMRSKLLILIVICIASVSCKNVTFNPDKAFKMEYEKLTQEMAPLQWSVQDLESKYEVTDSAMQRGCRLKPLHVACYQLQDSVEALLLCKLNS